MFILILKQRENQFKAFPKSFPPLQDKHLFLSTVAAKNVVQFKFGQFVVLFHQNHPVVQRIGPNRNRLVVFVVTVHCNQRSHPSEHPNVSWFTLVVLNFETCPVKYNEKSSSIDIEIRFMPNISEKICLFWSTYVITLVVSITVHKNVCNS